MYKRADSFAELKNSVVFSNVLGWINFSFGLASLLMIIVCVSVNKIDTALLFGIITILFFVMEYNDEYRKNRYLDRIVKQYPEESKTIINYV